MSYSCIWKEAADVFLPADWMLTCNSPLTSLVTSRFRPSSGYRHSCPSNDQSSLQSINILTSYSTKVRLSLPHLPLPGYDPGGWSGTGLHTPLTSRDHHRQQLHRALNTVFNIIRHYESGVSRRRQVGEGQYRPLAR